MTRRIKKELKQFLDSQKLTDKESSFILSCIQQQRKYPQLTIRQWDIICEIREKYTNK